MNKSELLELLNNGENSFLEFKEEQVRPNDLAAEIVAFANAEGGVILLGVGDKGEIKGVTDPNIEERIMNICRNNCIPNIIPLYEKFVFNEGIVVAITIPKGLSKPYYTVDNKYYIRVGSTKRIASKEELLRLFEASGSFHYDISPVYNTSMKDLHLDSIRDYFFKYNMFDLYEEDQASIQRILLNADILKETDQGIFCTVGGLLIFGKSPAERMPQVGISFAHFDGNDITEALIDKKHIVGRLPDVAEQTFVALKNNMKTYSIVQGLKRQESQEYPDIVLREAVVNALVHRNYSITGSRIRILMFEDRIEFHSPGRLPNTVTIEKMKIGVSYARNPFLVKYMENLRYIDQLGRGIPMIIKTMKDLRAKEPILKELGEEFILIIYRTGH
ncbi:MAG: RNA-binding domain-containing protein [Bacillota bacterium]